MATLYLFAQNVTRTICIRPNLQISADEKRETKKRLRKWRRTRESLRRRSDANCKDGTRRPRESGLEFREGDTCQLSTDCLVVVTMMTMFEESHDKLCCF